jgi:hypothetical protein
LLVILSRGRVRAEGAGVLWRQWHRGFQGVAVAGVRDSIQRLGRCETGWSRIICGHVVITRHL